MDFNAKNEKESISYSIDELKKENIKLKQELDALPEKVKILITKVSHDFKTPLNSIIGYSELLKSDLDNEKHLKYTSNILLNSEHMLELVQNIIDVTCSQQKPLKLEFSIFNTKEVIENIINSYKGANIVYTLINQSICADYTRFKQLVYNLISNAMKFSPENSLVEVMTYVEDSFFCFEISDNGEGISEENQLKIFDFFAQVSDDKQKREIGSGIGLALCKTITDAHSGFINVSSTPNVGSTFTFKLPIDNRIHS